MKISAILLAGGKGERLGNSQPKAFVKIREQEMFLHSLEVFEKHSKIAEVILVVPKNKISETKKLLARTVNPRDISGVNSVKSSSFLKVAKVVTGGKTRIESLKNGLRRAKGDFILAHNAANPFLNASEISRCVNLVKKWRAVGVGQRTNSTVRLNSKTLPREKVWLMETPQIVERKILEAGLRFAQKNKIKASDELQLAELAGVKSKVIEASKQNRKITHPQDLAECCSCSTKVGLGLDSHRFSRTKKPLILGGVKISMSGGLEGNSDGDVLLHALTNAISSGLGGGSLSTFADEMCNKGIKNSIKYLEVILEKMRSKNFSVENLAIAIEGKKPKLERHFLKIRKNLSKLLEVAPEKIGITVTSGEELTAFGRGEGLQVFVLILLKKCA